MSNPHHITYVPKGAKIKKGVLGPGSGSTDFLTISKNGVIQMKRENRIIAKKIISQNV
jgi:hypothetical protein